jgi:hypothetical protein
MFPARTTGRRRSRSEPIRACDRSGFRTRAGNEARQNPPHFGYVFVRFYMCAVWFTTAVRRYRAARIHIKLSRAGRGHACPYPCGYSEHKRTSGRSVSRARGTSQPIRRAGPGTRHRQGNVARTKLTTKLRPARTIGRRRSSKRPMQACSRIGCRTRAGDRPGSRVQPNRAGSRSWPFSGRTRGRNRAMRAPSELLAT